MEPSRKEIEDYLQSKVNPLFEVLMLDLIKSKPRNIVSFLWFEKKIETLAETQKQIQSDSETDSEEEFLDQKLIEEKKTKPRWYKQRNGICGEVFGTHHRVDDCEILSIHKSPSVNNRILFRLKSLFLFKDFDDGDTSKLISAMTIETYEENRIIIKQGDEGNEIYIVDEGELHCYRRSEGQEIYIKTIGEGEMFGEISMLYNTKRTANIRVKTKATCFKLDRKTFNTVIRQRNLRKRKIIMDIMKKIDIFRELETEEKYQVQDIIQEMPVHLNQYIIREGNNFYEILGKNNNKLFMVESGKLVGMKKEKNGHDKVFENYNDGDYFGVNSMISKQQSLMSVMAVTNSKLYYMEVEALEKVIGPVNKILHRNVDVYEKYKKP